VASGQWLVVSGQKHRVIAMPVDPLPILLPGIAAILFLAFFVGIAIVRRITRLLRCILAGGVIVIAMWWVAYFLSVWLMAMTARTPEEQYQVALAYWGRGSNNFPDYREAAKWMELAAESGHAGAQRQLAWFYIVPIGVPHDTVMAHYWMKKAAEQGDPNAAKDLDYFEKMYRK
jgi:hypothetical protein